MHLQDLITHNSFKFRSNFCGFLHKGQPELKKLLVLYCLMPLKFKNKYYQERWKSETFTALKNFMFKYNFQGEMMGKKLSGTNYALMTKFLGGKIWWWTAWKRHSADPFSELPPTELHLHKHILYILHLEGATWAMLK